MKRNIIQINPEQCNGCGLCIPNCPEGAIQIIDGKARLISDRFCDGLGACLGHCPQGAIAVEEREAEAYDERVVMENIVKQGTNTIRAHLLHLKDHGETELLNQALSVLKEKGIKSPIQKEDTMPHAETPSGCPGAQAMQFGQVQAGSAAEEGQRPSQLSHWPLQLHLISPEAPQYQGKDVLLSADCVAYSLGDFHKDYLKGKSLAIACPKLDEGQEIYVEKIKALIDDAKINTLSVMIMQVPCCRGLLAIAQEAAGSAKRKIPVKATIVGLQGQILSENWV